VAARLFVEDRVLLAEEDIPELLIQAFVAAEDQHFYEHDGIDFGATLRAVVGNAQTMAFGSGGLSGASTITQQVAKNLFLSSEVSLDRKLREAILAVRIEEVLDKDQIVEIYLNHIYFGQGAYGVAMAAATYFGKSVSELTLAEMAYLAGLPKAPSFYHPIRQRNSARIRRAYVLDRMVAEGFITEEEAQAAKANYQRLQRDALKEAEAILAHAREEAKRMRGEGEKKLEASLARREQLAVEKIAAAEAKALQDVREQMVDLAVAATRQLIETNIDDKVRSRLVADAVSEIPTRLQ